MRYKASRTRPSQTERDSVPKTDCTVGNGTSKKIKKKKRGFVQLHLDFGQKNFSSQVCKECGMRYTPGSERDERLHRKFHRTHITQSIPFKAGGRDIQLLKRENEERIMQLGGTIEHNLQKRTFLDLCRVMDHDFQFPLADLFKEHQKIYVFVKKSSIVGCLVMEKIETASLTRKWPSEEGFEPAKEKRISHGGIVLLWVAQKCRRQGIASALLDVARRCFIFGYCIPKEEVAFYLPTSAGLKFAFHYTHQDHALVYGTYRCDSSH